MFSVLLPVGVEMAAPTQTCGLINVASDKYLTGEKFGFTLNINGSSIKSKQIWQICSKEGGDHVYLRSPHNRYLAATEKGVVTADAEEMSGNAAFFFEPQANGRCAFKSIHNYYFGGSGDMLSCFSKTVGDQEQWIIHLAGHPQFCMRNVQRKRYVSLAASGNELQTSAELPWGPESLITLEFNRASGSYLLRASNNKVLSQSGKLTGDINDDSRFQLEFRGGKIAFRNANGKYLTGVGSTGTVQARREKCEKDELFVLEDSLPQVHLISHSGKYVSIARGVEVSAYQPAAAQTEIFQLTFVGEQVALRCANGKFMAAESSAVKSEGEEAAGNCLYNITFNGASINLQASNGKYVTTKLNGQLAASVEDASDAKASFTMNVVNRPLLVLRSDHGFVSTVSGAKDLRYECNRSIYEVLSLSVDAGVYTLQGANGKAVSMITESSAFAANGGEPARFHVQVMPNSRIALRVVGGKLLQGVSNGGLTATADSLSKETNFEY